MGADTTSHAAQTNINGSVVVGADAVAASLKNMSLTSEAKPDTARPPLTMDGPYTQDRALEDLPGVKHALDLFLAGYMQESEDYCHESDPKKERLYFASGFGLIQCVKALMSYEDEDLLAAIGHTKRGNVIAQQHRKKAASLASRVAGYVLGSSSSSGINWVKSMTPVERHAELIYAETLFEKALLGIVYSGDWLSFIKEALNMRTTFTTYRLLNSYLTAADNEARDRGEPEDTSIDPDFRSGVLLGAGMSNVILSLLPGRLLSIVELFGFKGNRKEGLELMYRAGGWREASDPQAALPKISKEDEGLRRSLIDMALLIFHLVLSSFTSEGVDVPRATNILRWNSARYPHGIFFLFGQGRINLMSGRPREAIRFYSAALTTQDQFRNMHQISHWETAIASLALWDLKGSEDCWRKLWDEASWSKACYVYGISSSLIEQGGEKNVKEAAEWLEKVPSVLKRIAGKSIPVEKFVARKARKFKSQGNRLALPALEFAYFFLAIGRSTPPVIYEHMLPAIEARQVKIREHEKSVEKYENGHGYWDDACLAWFLEGVCCRFLAYPEANASHDPEEREKVPISKDDAQQRSLRAFQNVLDNGSRIVFDHHLIYFAHFELGRLLANMGKRDEGRKHFELLLSGKPLEANTATRKGKYSLEVRLPPSEAHRPQLIHALPSLR